VGLVPGVTNYAHAGTSPTLYDVVTNPDGTQVPRLLTAGENPPEGVVVSYYLPANSPEKVEIAFLDADGSEIRAYASDRDEDGVSVKPGVNRFVWNMRYPGVETPKADDLGKWDRPDGGMVLPGRYRVRLTAGEDVQTQDFELLLDPRVTTSREDLAAQRDLLLKITDALGRTNRTIDQVDAMRAQVLLWQSRTGDEAVQAAAAPMLEELLEIRGKLIDVNIKGSQLWPSGLHEKFNALLDSVDRADYAPPQQAQGVYDQLSGQLDALVEQLSELSAGKAGALNDAIRTANLPTIGLPA
jgi:hypothetical protein